MGRLIKHTDDQYRIIQAFRAALKTVSIDTNDTSLLTFAHEIKSDLDRVLELHYDKNQILKKYYHNRELLQDLADDAKRL